MAIDQTATFYDRLAKDYHLVYADWESSIQRQAAALDRIIRDALGREGRRVLDCTCGIGTQSLGLASLGYEVVGTDLSPAAVERARREARRRGLDVRFDVADVRTLAMSSDAEFDVVLSADNSLPHLADESELKVGIDRMLAHLRPGGLFIASIRDYDSILEDPPSATPPTPSGAPGERGVTFQIWHWETGGRLYELEMFVLQEERDGFWRGEVHRARYRAVRRAELSEILNELGACSIRWLMPDSSGFFQPLILATRRA